VACFEFSNHSKTLGGQSLSGCGISTIGVPTFDWVSLPFPKMKYPLVDNEVENAKEEKRCLRAFKDSVNERQHTTQPIKAVIIEPISFLGTHFATPTFYQGLREICAKKSIPFIVDETRTGVGITGKYWAHDHWYLENAPDVVVFGRAT
jgi:4-aminobutyrate aminotransferase/(S)-3-amino-2-methylpropionate transaminase